MTTIRDCPTCEAKDSLETTLKIDLDDVVYDSNTNEVVSFILAGSANDPYNGLVTEEAFVSCRECGAEVKGVTVPLSFTNRWVYYDTSTKVEQAQRLAHLLNRGVAVFDALAQLSIEPEDVSSEGPNLALDDPDNDIIDLHANEHGLVAFVQRHNDRWHVHTVKGSDDDD